MRLFGIRFGLNPATLLAGLGVVLLAPPLLIEGPRVLRSAVKTAIKAGYIISNKMKFVYWDKDPSVVVGGPGSVYQTETRQSDLVYVSEKGKKYHKENCPTGFKAKRALPISDAVSKGYEPCKMCVV